MRVYTHIHNIILCRAVCCCSCFTNHLLLFLYQSGATNISRWNRE